MGKPCKAEGCYRQRWGEEYCSNHQYLRDDKKPKKPAFRTTKERVNEINFGFDDQINMFHALWENAKDENGIVICPYTGERLNRFYNTEMWYSCFAHVLPKGRYTYWKLNPDNLRVVFPLFHSYVDSKPLSARKEYPLWKFDLWDKEVIELKSQYQDFKNKNLLS